jgi:hypothetical protein
VTETTAPDTTPEEADLITCDVIVGVETYVGFDDAQDLAASRIFSGAWNAVDLAERARALRTATAILDRMRWKGRPLAPTQPLAWPRVPDRCPHGYPLDAPIPREIATACVELAIHLLSAGQHAGAPVQMRQLGDAMTMYFPTVADELPKHVRRLIEPHLRVSSANVAEVTL